MWSLIAAWAALVATALWIRPLLPVDETRYVGVAWEMWVRGDFLVPHLNGEAYSHKPPLLFWLMHAGWWLFGVGELWPRLINPLLGLASIGLTALLARRLWPQLPAAAALAPWILFGCIFFAGFLTLTQFDLLIVFCTLLGMLGMLRAAEGMGTGWLLAGLAIGLGLLSKGPVILLHLLPAALLGHLWVDRARLQGWLCWYGGLFAAVLFGVVIALAWALPAAQAGGEEYRQAIFWGQTADRVVDSFAHPQPFWWYLAWLPVLLLPWPLWPPLWRAARTGGRAALRERGVRFALCWAVPVVVVLSLVSGKQAKYLLPMFPALALLAAWWLARVPQVRLPRRQWLAMLLLALPMVLFAAVAVHRLGTHPHWAEALKPEWGELFLFASLLWWLWRPTTPVMSVRGLALAGAALLAAVHLAVLQAAAPAYDLTIFSARLAELQAARRPIVHVGKYHGQFHFIGRLREPLAVTRNKKTALRWAREHPDGYLILYCEQWPGPACTGGELVQDYRGDADDLVLWPARKFLAAQ
jgi:4-amino-4-deoxy-L-arabinose transferase-like glycosyltransferase